MLATVFFLALWVDPTQPVRSSTQGLLLLLTYMVLSAGLMIVAWRNWWWDHRLAWPVHVIDIASFLAAVYFTETTDDDFTSPFLAFFAFLMLSATIRWDWRITALTGVAASGLYLLVGLAMGSFGIELDMFRFGRRVTYMVVLSLVLIWFGLQRREQSIERFVEPPGSADDKLPPLLDALRYAMAQVDAQQGAIAWADDEEPYVEIRAISLDCASGRLSPEALSPDTPFAAQVQLFDLPRKRILRTGGWRCVTARRAVEDPFADHCRLDQGLALPFAAVTGRGEILLTGIRGVGADHVEIGGLIAREIGAGFDRQATLALVRESAVTRMRDAVARDLHDTIAQSLAGVSLRLEGLRRWIRDGGDPDNEIQAIKAALRTEQNQVRGMIARLRRGASVLPDATAAHSVGPLLHDLSDYWGIVAQIDEDARGIVIPGWLAHELRQVLREAVANAVRHGGAGRVAIALAEENGMLQLTVADDGTGFPADSVIIHPRSISERVAALGGYAPRRVRARRSRTALHLAAGGTLMVAVLLADDHPFMRAGVEAVLRGTRFEIVATANDGDEALAAIDQHDPAICIFDVRMPNRNGVEALQALREKGDSRPVVLLTAGLEDHMLLGAVRAGVNGIVLKDGAEDALLDALDKVEGGQRSIPQPLLQRALDLSLSGGKTDPLATLAPRERQIAAQVGRGLRNREIADTLAMSEGTVKVYLHTIYQKLGIKNRTELALISHATETGTRA